MARIRLLLFLAAVAACVASPPARASALDGQPAIRNKVLLYEGRHMFAPVFGATLGDPYATNLLGGVSYRYFFTDWFAIAVDVLGGGGVETQLTREINREISAEKGHSFELGRSELSFLGHAGVEFVPYAGKFMQWGSVLSRVGLHIDLGFLGVAVVTGKNGLEPTAAAYSPMIGAGLRLFFADWAALGIDARSYLVPRVLAGNRDGSVSRQKFSADWFNWLLGLSACFFFPTEPEIDR